MSSTFLEISGPDRSGKDTLSLAIDKRYEDLGMAPVWAHVDVVIRAMYDFSVLDRFFNRTDYRALYDRIHFLEKNWGDYSVIYLTASEEELVRRQQEQIDAGELDGSAYNKHVVDIVKMHQVYEDFYHEFKDLIDIVRYDTSEMSPEDIVLDLSQNGYIE